jgi:crotonobetainyl-CoA:carnitine CoA-transferase CaiB-like acyl-CoA transferase
MTPLPLDGVRVIDFCVVWAGTFGSLLLADLGAEVIKVENPYVWQPITRGAMARPPQILLDAGVAWAGGYPGNVPGPRPWNYCPTFVSLYRNKRSFSVDIRKPEGMDAFERLVACSDVLIENNATGTMEGLGITYDFLRGIRPDIIMARIPAYGSSGPYFDARALGVHLEGVMGHTLLRGYRDRDPSANTAIYSGDYLAGTQSAFAIMAALWHRRKTGEGQLVEVAQAENAAAMFSQALMDYSLNRRIQSTIGNRDIHGGAPCGVFPCASPGSPTEAMDRWLSIHCQNDAEWEALVEVMGRPQWALDPELATADGRRRREDDIEQRIAEWTQGEDDYDLFHRLQSAGVPAAPVLEASRALEDPQFGPFYQRHAIPDAGEHTWVAPIFRFSETPLRTWRGPAQMGQDNDYVYREVLGFSEDEYQRMKDLGHVSMDYDASVP